MNLHEAVADLHRIAVADEKPTSTRRLRRLAKFVVDELALRGLDGALMEVFVAGGARTKSWDVSWSIEGKPRLVVSLKSILRNPGGTVPNRIDDLIGEVTNVQMYSPEIVTGYVMVFNIAEDAFSTRHQCTWSDLLRSRIARLSGRRPPSWSIGMIEASWFVEVDFSHGPRIVSGEAEANDFFDRLVEEVRRRNPAIRGES